MRVVEQLHVCSGTGMLRMGDANCDEVVFFAA